MLKLKFSKPSVKTYKDGKITVCKYKCMIIDNCTKEVLSAFNAKGISVCSDSDTVNAECGRRLADSRAKYNAYKEAASIMNIVDREEFVNKVKVGIDVLFFYEEMQYLKKAENRHIRKLNEDIALGEIHNTSTVN